MTKKAGLYLNDRSAIGQLAADEIAGITEFGTLSEVIFAMRSHDVGSGPERLVVVRLIVPTDQLVTMGRVLIGGPKPIPYAAEEETAAHQPLH